MITFLNLPNRRGRGSKIAPWRDENSVLGVLTVSESWSAFSTRLPAGFALDGSSRKHTGSSASCDSEIRGLNDCSSWGYARGGGYEAQEVGWNLMCKLVAF